MDVWADSLPARVNACPTARFSHLCALVLCCSKVASTERSSAGIPTRHACAPSDPPRRFGLEKWHPGALEFRWQIWHVYHPPDGASSPRVLNSQGTRSKTVSRVAGPDVPQPDAWAGYRHESQLCISARRAGPAYRGQTRIWKRPWEGVGFRLSARMRYGSRQKDRSAESRTWGEPIPPESLRLGPLEFWSKADATSFEDRARGPLGWTRV